MKKYIYPLLIVLILSSCVSSKQNKDIIVNEEFSLPLKMVEYYRKALYEENLGCLENLKRSRNNEEYLNKAIAYRKHLVKVLSKAPLEVPYEKWKKMVDLLKENPKNKLFYYHKKFKDKNLGEVRQERGVVIKNGREVLLKSVIETY